MTAETVDRPLSGREVADRLGVHPNTVKAIPADVLPFFRVNSRGDRRYARADVEAYIASRRVG